MSELDWPDLSAPLTTEQRRQMYYNALAGDYPGPNASAIAAILAVRLVELEDEAAA